jgi:hypothetical protein
VDCACRDTHRRPGYQSGYFAANQVDCADSYEDLACCEGSDCAGYDVERASGYAHGRPGYKDRDCTADKMDRANCYEDRRPGYKDRHGCYDSLERTDCYTPDRGCRQARYTTVDEVDCADSHGRQRHAGSGRDPADEMDCASCYQNSRADHKNRLNHTDKMVCASRRTHDRPGDEDCRHGSDGLERASSVKAGRAGVQGCRSADHALDSQPSHWRSHWRAADAYPFAGYHEVDGKPCHQNGWAGYASGCICANEVVCACRHQDQPDHQAGDCGNHALDSDCASADRQRSD